ncbi:Uncharacterised protein [Neisseria mucosa]|nr:Uncharacterised protein [Neisseria mucosa]
MFRVFFFRRPATPESAAIRSLPRGGGLGRGHSSIFGNLSQHSSAQIQALRLAALSLTLSHGREDGEAVGMKGFARKRGCAGCFLLFRRPAINGCKPKLPFKSLATAKSAATRFLPCGGGLGRGHSPSSGNLSQHLNLPNTSLAACCPLSSSLPRGERTGWLLGLRGLQEKQIVQAAFYFSDDLKSTTVNPSCFSNRLQPQNLL